MSELHLHINHASITNRTAVRTLAVFIVAVTMNTMTTAHENDSFEGGKHIFSAYRAIAVS